MIAIEVVVVVAVVVVTAVYALGLPQCLSATIAMVELREGGRKREREYEYSFSPSSGTFNNVNDNWSWKIRKHLLPAAAFSVGSLNSIRLNRCESS